IELTGERDQLVLHVDDLIEPGPEQIAFPSRLVLFRPHRPLRCSTESLFAPKGNPKNEIARFQAPKPKNLAISQLSEAQKTTLSQSLNPCSRATIHFNHSAAEIGDIEVSVAMCILGDGESLVHRSGFRVAVRCEVVARVVDRDDPIVARLRGVKVF